MCFFTFASGSIFIKKPQVRNRRKHMGVSRKAHRWLFWFIFHVSIAEAFSSENLWTLLGYCCWGHFSGQKKVPHDILTVMIKLCQKGIVLEFMSTCLSLYIYCMMLVFKWTLLSYAIIFWRYCIFPTWHCSIKCIYSTVQKFQAGMMKKY